MERVQNTTTNYIITTITSGVPEIVQLLLLHSPATPKIYRGIVSFSLCPTVFFSADGRRSFLACTFAPIVDTDARSDDGST